MCNTFTVFLLEMWSFFFLERKCASSKYISRCTVSSSDSCTNCNFFLFLGNPIPIVTMTKLLAYIAMPECHELSSEPGLPSIRPRENDLYIFEVQLLP